MEISKLRGMKDILPPEIELWKSIEKVFIDICENFGYKEIRFPVVESKYLFVRSVGEFSDIVMKEMYEFKDKKGREVALRPEGTASVVRAYIENRIYTIKKIARFYYYGPMFRYDRPQKGRYRQFYQFGVEVFGGKHPYFDGEVVFILSSILRKINVGNFTFLINSLGCDNCKGKYVEEIKNYFLKNISSLCDDCKIRVERNPLRILDCKNSNCQSLMVDIPSILNFLCDECKDHFEKFVDFLERFNIRYEINHKLVRGLDYYTKTVFEVITDKEDMAIAGGGRYDKLVKEMGGPDIPAVGFAVGMDRLISLLKFENLNEGNSIILILLGDRAKIKGIEIMEKLADEKIKFETDYEDRSLSEYLKIANKTGKKWCLIIGDNEIEKGIVLLKNMEKGTQEEIREEEIIYKIKERLKC